MHASILPMWTLIAVWLVYPVFVFLTLLRDLIGGGGRLLRSMSSTVLYSAWHLVDADDSLSQSGLLCRAAVGHRRQDGAPRPDGCGCRGGRRLHDELPGGSGFRVLFRASDVFLLGVCS